MKKAILSLLFSVIGILTVVTTSDASTQLTQLQAHLAQRESNFLSFVQQTIDPFWQQQLTTGSFKNRQNLTIHYAYAIPEQAKQAIVISPGRGEGYLKYKELTYDFYQLGYAVFIIDHQGQGLSERRLTNRFKGYVEQFDDYVHDFQQFIQQVVTTEFQGELMLVSHSMGGAIGLRYIQQFPDVFQKVVFSSPMWALNAGPVPKPIAKGLLSLVAWGSNLFSDQSPYFFGGQDYNAVPFEENVLTHSNVRYQYFRDTYQQQPALQLGSVTINWIQQSVSALDQAFEQLDEVKLPVLVLQSGDDEVIDNEGQNRFCQRLKATGNPCLSGQPVVIEQAKHELFIEQDDKRTTALTHIIQFLTNNDGLNHASL